MKVGDLVKLNKSERRNGRFAGKLGIVIDLDAWENPTINVEGEVKAFHYTQVVEIIYAGW